MKHKNIYKPKGLLYVVRFQSFSFSFWGSWLVVGKQNTDLVPKIHYPFFFACQEEGRMHHQATKHFQDGKDGEKREKNPPPPSWEFSPSTPDARFPTTKEKEKVGDSPNYISKQ